MRQNTCSKACRNGRRNPQALRVDLPTTVHAKQPRTRIHISIIAQLLDLETRCRLKLSKIRKDLAVWSASYVSWYSSALCHSWSQERAIVTRGYTTFRIRDRAYTYFLSVFLALLSPYQDQSIKSTTRTRQSKLYTCAATTSCIQSFGNWQDYSQPPFS